MNKFSCIFYPFVTKSEIEAIKFASLYFDEIFVLTPISVITKKEFKKYYDSEMSEIFRKNLVTKLRLKLTNRESLKHESVKANMLFQKIAEPLIKEKVIHIVNPFDEMKNQGMENEFQSIIDYRAREFKPSKTLQRPMMKAVIACDERDMEVDDFTYCNQLYEARNEAVQVIMFDSATLISKTYNSIPLTSSSFYNDQFCTQIQDSGYRSKQYLPKPLFNKMCPLKEFEKNRTLDAFKIASYSILENVPHFEDATFEDILKLRSHCAQELNAFRIEARKLASSITEGEPDIHRTKEIIDIVSKEVTPILNQMERKLKLTKQNWTSRLVNKISSLQSVATLVTTVFVGFPLYYGFLIATGIAGAQATLETIHDEKDIKIQNGLSFLLKMKKITK